MNAARLEVLVFTLLLGGCATSNNPQDPLEGYNRAMFGFNDKADKFVMKPVATAYHTVLPSFVQTGIGTVSENDVKTALAGTIPGVVLAFNVGIDPIAEALARERGIRIETFNIIYKLTERLQELPRCRRRISWFYSRSRDERQ